MGQVGQSAVAVGGAGDRVVTATAAGDMSLVFRAGSLLCALRLDEVVETMRPLAVQPLVGTPPFVPGISIMRGVPVPVVDVTRLLGGGRAAATRFVAVRTERGPIALATGPVLGIRPTVTANADHHTGLLGAAPARLVAAIGTVDAEPLIQLRSMRLVPDEVWAAVPAPEHAS
jgi:purine-binding chemotaxis protein CheW